MADPYLDDIVAGDFLPSSIVNRDDFGYLRDKAEREVKAHYTRKRKGFLHRVSGLLDIQNLEGVDHLLDSERKRVVMLQYYEENPTDVDESDTEEAKFLEAMRAEIAGVVEYYVETEGHQEGVKSERRGDRSKTYEGKTRRFPRGFGRYLKPFDLRPKSTHI